LLEKAPDALEVSVVSFYFSYPQVLRGRVGAPPPGEPKKAGPSGLLLDEKRHPEVTHEFKHVGGLRIA